MATGITRVGHKRPLLRVNHHVWSAFCPPRGIALVRGRLAGLQPALRGEERRFGRAFGPLPASRPSPKPRKSATARPPPLAVAQGPWAVLPKVCMPPPVPGSAELSHCILTSLGFSFFLLGPLGSSRPDRTSGNLKLQPHDLQPHP